MKTMRTTLFQVSLALVAALVGIISQKLQGIPLILLTLMLSILFLCILTFWLGIEVRDYLGPNK